MVRRPRLNFAENLLRHRDERAAFRFRGETRKTNQVTYAELHDQVVRLAGSLRELGVRPGDRICAYMPNIIQAAIAMLASTTLGAVWTSCGAELGPTAVLDRFQQVQPRVLFTVDGYFYKNQVFDTLSTPEKLPTEFLQLKK